MSTLPETTLAYMAGIIDGEGSIVLNRTTANSMQPLVAVSSTDGELIDWLMDNFGGRFNEQKKYKEHHTQAWIWRIRSNAAIEMLRGILPYLVIERKRKRAELLVQDWARLTPRNGKYTPAQRKAKDKLVRQFR